MSIRRIDTANNKIFTRLTQEVYQKETDGKKRYICTSSKDDDTVKQAKEYIKRTKISNTFTISHHIFSAILEYEQEKYFVISGIDTQFKDELQNIEIYELGVEEKRDALVGLIVVVLSEYELAIARNYSYTSMQIENEILSQYDNEYEYAGHSYEEIQKCFLPIRMFDISNIDLTIYQLAGIILCNQDENYLQPLSEENIAKFNDIFKKDFKDISGENIESVHENLVYALYSISWKHRFLELYRCVENLYPIFAVKKLYDSLNINREVLDIKNFYKEVNDKLQWHGKEIDSLTEIVTTVSDIDNIFSDIINGKKIYNFLYDLRNSIVHFCIVPSKNKANNYEDFDKFDNKKWNTIILGMLELIDKIYEKYQLY